MKKVDNSVSLEALTGLAEIPASVMRRLLSQHGVALREAGLDPAALAAGDLWAHRDRLPTGLVDAFHRIHDMSDDAGYDQLLHAVGGPLFVADGGVLPSIAVAAQILVDHPAQFNRAHGRRFVEALRKFREFPGRLPVAPTLNPDAVRLAEQRFGKFFLERGRSAWCRIRCWHEGDSVHFMVSHGRCPRTDDAVYEAAGVPTEHTLVWRPQQHDLLLFDPRTGRLRISASDAPTLHEYLVGFGRLLFGDPRWFRDGPVVSLDPLIYARNDVLRPTPGVLAVRLTELEVGSRSENLASILLRGDDVARFLDESWLDPAAHGPLRQAKFRLRFASDGRWRSVGVGVPDRLTGDWRRDGAVVRRFLELRGLLAGPPPTESELAS